MPAKNPRIMVVMERPLYYLVRKKASKDGVSLSTEVRDLVRHSLKEDEAPLIDEAFHKALSATMDEWASREDEKAFRDL